jgi:formylglycine-generating enzyme required for sulfatase activity
MRWDGGQPFKGEEEHPVTGVTWCDALAYCQWLSDRLRDKTGRTYTLPSEAHWERAARGVDGRIYPWGSEWQDGRCHVSKEGVASVKLYPAQIEHGGQGVHDLVGNAPEWTSTIWGLEALEPHYPQPWQQDDGRDDLSANSQMRRIVRGGAASDPPEKLRCAARSSTLPLQPGPFGKRHGFRVMMVLGQDRLADSFCGSEG